MIDSRRMIDFRKLIFNISMRREENSYFILLINIPLPLYKELDVYNDTYDFYTKPTLKKDVTFRFRLRTIKSIKALTNMSWFSRLIKSFIIISIESIYRPIKWVSMETVQDAEDRLATTIKHHDETFYSDIEIKEQQDLRRKSNA